MSPCATVSAVANTKACSKCGASKPLNDFRADPRYRLGRKSWCLNCEREHNRVTARARWQTPEVKDRRLQREYGLSLADVEDMLWSQAGLCGVCAEPMSPGAGTHIDHDHGTGAVRGLLCGRCNQGIGLLRHDALIMSAAQNYISV